MHTHAQQQQQQQLPTWEVLSDDSPSRAPATPGGPGKRSYDAAYSVDDFFTDVKKRRVNPAYDPRMSLLCSPVEIASN